MGPNPGLSRAPSMSDLKIRGSEQRDKEREHRESRRPGTGGDKAGGDRDHRRRESSAARRDHHRRESRREDSTDRYVYICFVSWRHNSKCVIRCDTGFICMYVDDDRSISHQDVVVHDDT